jgi:two-component system, OmpR family, response regulator RegX3
MHIALIEDDVDQRNLITLLLTNRAHTVAGFESIKSAIDSLNMNRFDLLLVDWMLPDGCGVEVLTWTRSNLGWEIPVIVLTARDDEATVCEALKAGSDDYIVKPAKPMELLARIEAVARRSKPGAVPVIRMGAFEIDAPRQTLTINGSPVQLTQKEFDLSVCLFQSPGKLLSRDHLLNKVWGLNVDVDTRTVDTHISRLRKKVFFDANFGWQLIPVYGFGYRLVKTIKNTE